MISISSPLALPAAFLIGSIPSAFLMGRLKGVDIRQHGSGNVGATNAFRVLGRRWGIACLAADALKGWLPVTLLRHPAGFGLNPEGWMWALAMAAIAGHMFSPFLGFRGGKGVATSLGALLAIAPLPMLITLLVGILIIWRTGYVSLASMTGAMLLPVLILALSLPSPRWLSVGMTAGLAVLIVWKHRANIERLRRGQERKLFDKPASGEAKG